MTKEQEAIKYLEIMNKNIDFNKMGYVYAKEAIETALNIIKEKDKKIEYYKKQKNYDDQFKHELLEEIRCLNLDKNEKDKDIQKINKYVEYIESKLNKVTDKLKEVKEIALEDKEKKKIIELPNGIRYEDKVISLDTFIYVIDNLLNIIEGEKE